MLSLRLVARSRLPSFVDCRSNGFNRIIMVEGKLLKRKSCKYLTGQGTLVHDAEIEQIPPRLNGGLGMQVLVTPWAAGRLEWIPLFFD